ncbi:MAG TPA: hypothetical protein VK629_02410 [Steroidobacteraceae bacterium]|nr:hypothetical protein [Steroidobacteraceae bacterium]
MNKKVLSSLLVLSVLSVGVAQGAMNEADKRYVDRLAKGGPETIRDVAQSLFESGSTNTEVLDVAAEVLLQKYPRAALDRNSADAAAWLCRALGGSGNNRYKAAIDEVSDKADHRKLRGHCEKASKALPKGAAESYKAGTVDLEKLRNSEASASTKAAPAKAAAAAKPAAQGGARTVDFSIIREGMSSEEVSDLLGPPTATTQRMTGKQFRPFNYGARDLQRLYFLYKGVGRIEFSLKSAYEGVYRVITITPDAAESGYP